MGLKYTLIIFKLELKSIQNLKSTNYIKMEKFKNVLKHKWYPNIFGMTTLFSTVLFLYESKGNIDIIILISSAALFQFILRLPNDRWEEYCQWQRERYQTGGYNRME